MVENNPTNQTYAYLAFIILIIGILIIGNWAFNLFTLKINNRDELKNQCTYDCNLLAKNYHAIIFKDNNTICQCVPYKENISVIWETKQ